MSDIMPCSINADADFVKKAALHREPRLADCTLRSVGPHPMLPGDSIYLFAGTVGADGLAMAFAVSLPDKLVAARDMDRVQKTFFWRDIECAGGAPSWMKPIGD